MGATSGLRIVNKSLVPIGIQEVGAGCMVSTGNWNNVTIDPGQASPVQTIEVSANFWNGCAFKRSNVVYQINQIGGPANLTTFNITEQRNDWGGGGTYCRMSGEDGVITVTYMGRN